MPHRVACYARAMAYEPTLKSLNAHPVPQWYEDAKFGIFIHWGLFSIPAFAAKSGSIADTFRSVGGEIRQSWCGPCFGQGEDSLTAGQRAITSFNRNWQNRMGLG